MYYFLTIFFFFLLVVGDIEAQFQYDMRFTQSKVSHEDRSACYDLQIRSASGVWSLDAFVVSVSYDASFAQGGSFTSSMPSSAYSFNRILDETLPVGAFPDVGVAYDEIGFMRYNGGYDMGSDQPLEIGSEWVSLALLCFDIIRDPLEAPDNCMQIDFMSEIFRQAIIASGSNLPSDEVSRIGGDARIVIPSRRFSFDKDSPGACLTFQERSEGECSDGLDNDGDGLIDCEDLSCGYHCDGPPAIVIDKSCPLDNDGDGVSDDLEKGLDTDGDGIPDTEEIDDDNDGIATIDEDADGDGDPTNDDVDNNGVADYLQCEPLITEVTVTPASCSDDDALVVLTVSGGLEFEYRVEDLGHYTIYTGTEPTIDGLAGGEYYLYVTNTLNQCVAERLIYIESEAPIIYDVFTRDVYCGEEAIGYITIGSEDILLEYRLGDGAWQSEAFFTGLTAGIYNVSIRNNDRTCEVMRRVELIKQACAEDSNVLCSDGIDNDADGLVDCLDDDCQIYLQDLDGDGIPDQCDREDDVISCTDGIDNDNNDAIDCEEQSCTPRLLDLTIQPEICGDGQGEIIVVAEGTGLTYTMNDVVTSTDGVFSGLTNGEYKISISSDQTTCVLDLATSITIENTCEICDNGIDDDGDGDIDCADTQCGVQLSNVEAYAISCDATIDDGQIVVTTDQEGYSYHLTGTYYDESDQQLALDITQEVGVFTDLSRGYYALEITHGTSGCVETIDDLIIRRACEICDNGIDDDLDGYEDCDDEECLINDLDVPIASVVKPDGATPIKNLSDDDVCGMSDEEILELLGERESARDHYYSFSTSDIGQPCKERFYYLSPDGRLIDREGIDGVSFVRLDSDLYDKMRYVVGGITIGQYYYQAKIISNNFIGYYLYDREQEIFDANDVPLESVYASGVDEPNVLLAEYVDEGCRLKVTCLLGYHHGVYSSNVDLIQGKIRNRLKLAGADGSFQLTTISICDDDDEVRDIVIFSNGFRAGIETGFQQIVDGTPLIWFTPSERVDQGVWTFDRYGYWNLDGKWKKALQAGEVLYVDGHANISTSNHRNVGGFAGNISRATNGSAVWGLFADWKNNRGFKKRVELGRATGDRIIDMIRNGQIKVDVDPVTNKIKQKIDIVAHSMGYAYAVGLVDAIKDNAAGVDIDLGRFYILAPENANSRYSQVPFDSFDEVWQYGSQRDDVKLPDDPIKQQDAVASQLRIPGIFEYTEDGLNQYGRAYIPSQLELALDPDIRFTKWAIPSHSEDNYRWIFKITDPKRPGYVDSKN